MRALAVLALTGLLFAGLAGVADAQGPDDPCVPPYAEREAACVLPSDALTFGFLAEAGQTNWYRVDAPPGLPLRVDLVLRSADYDLYLCDPDGNVLLQSAHDDLTSEMIRFVASEGTYVLVVWDASKGVQADPGVPYLLRVRPDVRPAIPSQPLPATAPGEVPPP